MYFEANLGAKPEITRLDEAPRVAILVNSASPNETDTSWSLRQIFGPDVGFVSVTAGPGSLQNAAADPLADFDVIYNAGQAFPSGSSATARARLRSFFQRGGGYIATSQNTNNFSFLRQFVNGNLAQGSSSAYGGIARWTNEGTEGPVTGVTPRATSSISRLTSPGSSHFRWGRPWTGDTSPR